MSLDLLRIHNRIPLEREYEGWITREIEDYLLLSQRKATIFAVGSKEENEWPADEQLNVAGKVIGLQFKAPDLGSPPPPGTLDESELHWNLSLPRTQLPLIVDTPEISYCLPTFIDPMYKRVSLQHCLFWRPCDKTRKTAWYNNSKAQAAKSYLRIEDAPRWGHFIEKVFRCNEGKQIAAGKGKLRTYLSDLRDAIISGDSARSKTIAAPRQSKWQVIVIFVEGEFQKT